MFSHCIQQRFLIRYHKPILNGYSTLQLLRFPTVILLNDYHTFTCSQVQILYDEKLLNVTSVQLSAANWVLERFSGF